MSDDIESALSADAATEWQDLCHQRIAIDANDHGSMAALGLSLLQQGDSLQAIHWLHQAIRCNDNTIADYRVYLGLAYLKRQDLAQASAAFDLALQHNPTHTVALNALANVCEQQGAYHTALQHYAKALEADPGLVDTHYRLGELFIRVSKTEAAITQFSNVLALDPHHIKAQRQLGSLYLTQGQLEKAEQYLKKALSGNHEDVDALVNLGIVRLQQDQPQQAIDLFAQALAYDNHHLPAKSNLASTFMQYHRYDNAWTHYQELITTYPKDEEFRYNGAVALMQMNRLEEGGDHFCTLLKINPDHAHAHVNLAAIYARQNNSEHAKCHLEQALRLNPMDAASRHMLHALNGVATETTPTSYVEQLFNGYAWHYDHHMQQQLDYQLPQLVPSLLHKQVTPPVPCVLDLGCGTGLLAASLRPLAEQLIGIDVAENMLSIAKTRRQYDNLVHAEVVDYLTHDSPEWQLALAVEVLPYFGEMTPLFAALQRHAAPGATFVTTFEVSHHSASGYQLQTSGRFSHTPTYVAEIAKAHGASVVAQRHIQLRNQYDHKVTGSVMILRF